MLINGKGGLYPHLMLLPEKIHEALVLLTGARGERGGTGPSQGVVLLIDRSTWDLQR